MSSDKKTSFVVKLMLYPMVLMAVVFVVVALLDNKKTERVAKHHVTMAKVVEKREVASRVVRGGEVYAESNAPVTMVTVASKKQRETELREQIAKAMKEQQ